MELRVNRVLAGLFAGLVAGGATAQVLGLGVGVGMGAGGSVSISVPLPQAARSAARARNARTGALGQQAPAPMVLQPSPTDTVVLQPQSPAPQVEGVDPTLSQHGEAITPAGETVAR
jgi:hypothetical protein